MKTLDRRWIFLSLGLLVFVFLKVPFPTTYKPGRHTEDFYKAVESLPPGSIVFIAVDYGPASQAELLPMHKLLVYHMFKRNLRIVAGSVWNTSPPIVEKVFKSESEALAREGNPKKYGVDYVNLGFKSGDDVAIAKVGSSIVEAFPRDYRGTPVGKIPIMQKVRTFRDTALLISLSVGQPGVRQWIQQVQTRYRVRMIAGVVAVMAPDMFSFYQSKQIEGFLGGLVGAAEYEEILHRPGFGKSGMNVQSLAHLLILGFVAAGNIIFFFGRRKADGAAAKGENQSGDARP